MNSKKPKRKLRLAHIVYGLGRAGREVGIVKLLNNINPDYFDTTLIVVYKILDYCNINLSKTRIIVLNEKKGNNFLLAFKFYKLFKKEKFDIVHTHSWGTLVDGVIGAKMANVPVIVHGEHGTFPTGWPHRQIQQLLWRFSDRILSVSKNMAQTVSDVTGFPLNKFDIILNGVDEKMFYPSSQLRNDFRKEQNFAETDFVVGTVGRLSKVKNQAMMIRALKSVIDQGEKIYLVLVGSGEKEKELRMLAKDLKVTQFVRFLGKRYDINKILNGFDVFTLTSLSEGCSNVIQEAMSCAKAIIATEVGGNSELILHNYNGILIESDNHSQLAEEILRLKRDTSLRQTLGSNARERVLKEFSLPVMVRAYEKLYLDEFSRKYGYEY